MEAMYFSKMLVPTPDYTVSQYIIHPTIVILQILIKSSSQKENTVYLSIEYFGQIKGHNESIHF
jgi:hypothetical protein